MKKIIFIGFIFLIGLQELNGQNLFPGGVEFLSEEEYQQLPKINWDILKPNKGTVLRNSNIVMLKSPPVGNQGTQSSCVGWAVGYAAMSILAYPNYLNNWDEAIRSPNYIYNQIKSNPNDCDEGCYIDDALDLAKEQGVCSYKKMPYIEYNCMELPNKKQKKDASFNKLLLWGTVTPNNVSEMKAVISLGYPIVIACYVYESFDNMWVTDGIWDNFDMNEPHRGKHATCIIGYDDTKQMFKGLNSWGKQGGDDGYFWITYDLIRRNCLKEAYVVYGITPPDPKLTGPSQLCSQATYTIENIPAGASITWSTSNDNVELIDGQGTTTAVFRKNGSGVSKIIAYVSFGTTSKSLEKDITLGSPTSAHFGLYNQHHYQVAFGCVNKPYYLSVFAPTVNNGYDYKWTIDGHGYSDNLPIFGEKIDFSAMRAGYYTFTLKYKDVCGDDEKEVKRTYDFSSCGASDFPGFPDNPGSPDDLPYPGGDDDHPGKPDFPDDYPDHPDFPDHPDLPDHHPDLPDEPDFPGDSDVLERLGVGIYPNPAHDQIRIELEEKDKTLRGTPLYQIEIWRNNRILLKTLKTRERSLNINIADFPAGIYHVLIKRDGEVTKQTFLKK